jgi:hypothetical protein
MGSSSSDPSWRLKRCRAEQHLRDLADEIAPFYGRNTYPVSEGFEYEDNTRVWIRRVIFPEPDDPMLPILAGELMFNLRSALDHLAAALVPPARRTPKIIKDTQFPIFSRDIDKIDPATGKHVHRNERSNFERMTKGFPDKAIPLVKGLQPYMLSAQQGAENHALSILATLQNADKHRQLVIVSSGLANPVIRHTTASGLVTYESQITGLPADRRLQSRAVVDRSPVDDLADVQVEVEGTSQVMIGEGGHGPYHECIDTFAAMFRLVRQAFERLEPFVSGP